MAPRPDGPESSGGDLPCTYVVTYEGSSRDDAEFQADLDERAHRLQGKNPLHQVVRDNADHVRLLARELGLSPAARAGLQLLPDAELPDIDTELGPPPRLRVVGDG